MTENRKTRLELSKAHLTKPTLNSGVYITLLLAQIQPSAAKQMNNNPKRNAKATQDLLKP